ncbi:hypothetical protein TNCV_2145191 [Trichonephila clavipes]|uniref:Uncharacterized protein n=1 Tax=Trichonephila clavipes TaxID=2585209 RepID=A0A8X6SUT2_TRICX|nr:hypothetical protein TNCV_2145191 [Trichonephila clavipes]
MLKSVIQLQYLSPGEVVKADLTVEIANRATARRIWSQRTHPDSVLNYQSECMVFLWHPNLRHLFIAERDETLQRKDSEICGHF